MPRPPSSTPASQTRAVATSVQDAALAPDFDSAFFRNALGRFATGVTIITARTVGDDGRPCLLGFTANSFNSVSLEPPLVLWSLATSASSLATFVDSEHYVVNVLASDQIALSRRFGSRTRPTIAPVSDARFDDVAWSEGAHGAPILDGCCAWFECFNRSRYEEGDHVIFVGEVERCGFSEREPLIFQGGDYHTTRPHPAR